MYGTAENNFKRRSKIGNFIRKFISWNKSIFYNSILICWLVLVDCVGWSYNHTFKYLFKIIFDKKSSIVQYREALQQRRQEAVATAAIEALTKDSILHRKDVKTLVKAHKDKIQLKAQAKDGKN